MFNFTIAGFNRLYSRAGGQTLYHKVRRLRVSGGVNFGTGKYSIWLGYPNLIQFNIGPHGKLTTGIQVGIFPTRHVNGSCKRTLIPVAWGKGYFSLNLYWVRFFYLYSSR